MASSGLATGQARAQQSLMPLQLMVMPEHLPDIPSSFSNPRDPVALHALHTGIIGGERQGDIAIVPVNEVMQSSRTCPNILERIERIVDMILLDRTGHELHETQGALV